MKSISQLISKNIKRDFLRRQMGWCQHKRRVIPDLASGVRTLTLLDIVIQSPWSSAMAQGQAISVLLRAYQFTGKETYLESARIAMNAFYIPLKDGGLKTSIKGGLLFFDEYPANPPTRVLNGFIFACLESMITIGSRKRRRYYLYLMKQ